MININRLTSRPILSSDTALPSSSIHCSSSAAWRRCSSDAILCDRWVFTTHMGRASSSLRSNSTYKVKSVEPNGIKYGMKWNESVTTCNCSNPNWKWNEISLKVHLRAAAMAPRGCSCRISSTSASCASSSRWNIMRRVCRIGNLVSVARP